MTALQAAERRAQAAERAVTAARAAVDKAAVLDPRLILMLGTDDARRVAFEKATEAMRAARWRSDEAQARLQKARKAAQPKPSPKVMREALKAAITAQKRAASAVKRNEQAIERAAEMIGDASVRLGHAEAALEKARERDAASAVKAAARAGALPTQSSMQKARAAQQAAADAVDAARAARAKLEAQQGDLADANRVAKDKVEEAVANVLKAEVPVTQILTKTEALMEELVRLRIILREMLRADLVADANVLEVLWITELPGAFGHGGGDWSKHPATVKWEQMRTRLMADADAPLEF
jgi:hypothetical protein